METISAANLCVKKFDPWFGCTKVSPGCDNCFPEQWDRILDNQCWGDNPRKMATDREWRAPLKWNENAKAKGIYYKVNCAFECDWADEQVPDSSRDRLWQLIRNTPHLRWHLLTKRASLIASYLPADWDSGYHNVSLGVSVENVQHGVQRIDILRGIPAHERFIYFAPLLENLGDLNLAGINCVHVLGEMGKGRRPMKKEWAKRIRLQCQQQGVEFIDIDNVLKAAA